MKHVDSEDGLLLVLLVVAAYMFVGSFSFTRAAAIFPRYTAGATILGAGLLLYGKHTSGRLSEIREVSVDMYDDENLDIDQKTGDEPNGNEDATGENGAARSNGYEDRIASELFTVLSICGYVTLSYLIGMLWASPIFVWTYTTYLGLRRGWRLALSLAGFLIAFVFMIVINAPLDEGIVTLVEF